MPSSTAPVPLPTVHNITAITKISPAPDKYIYGAKNGDGSDLVIKMEAVTVDDASMAHGLGMMAQLSPGGETKLMSAQEVAEVQNFVNNRIADDLLLNNGVSPQYILDLDLALQQQGRKWTKARLVTNLSTLADAAAALNSAAANRKDGVRAFARMLNNEHGLEAIGRMVAVDAYNHNLDRFDPTLLMTRELTSAQSGQEISVLDKATLVPRRVLVNSGNVFITFQRERNRLVGLDSFDPYQSFHLGDTINAREDFAGMWAGWILQDTPRGRRLREAYAELIAEDLNDILGRRDRRFSFLRDKRLDSNAPHRIRIGMKAQRDVIVAALKRLCANGGGTKGLQDRYNIIVKGQGHPMGSDEYRAALKKG